MFVFCLESEDEVEEIEERVPSPDVTPEESAPFYDSTAWYRLIYVPEALTTHGHCSSS